MPASTRLTSSIGTPLTMKSGCGWAASWLSSCLRKQSSFQSMKATSDRTPCLISNGNSMRSLVWREDSPQPSVHPLQSMFCLLLMEISIKVIRSTTFTVSICYQHKAQPRRGILLPRRGYFHTLREKTLKLNYFLKTTVHPDSKLKTLVHWVNFVRR